MHARPLLVLVLPALFATSAAAQPADGPGPIRAVRVLTEAPVRGRCLEVAVELAGDFANPFDPGQAHVEARFEGPGGASATVAGFAFRDFTRRLEGGHERLAPAGSLEWRVRFTPRVAGGWTFRVRARTAAGAGETPPATFACADAPFAGFLRVAANRRYFEREDGSAWFAVGENVCWSGPRGTYDYDDWFGKLAQHGGNYARLWIGPFDSFTLERVGSGPDDPAGLGRYDLTNAWRIDAVVALAERLGISLLFCLESFNSLRIRPDHAMWDRSPYHAANGGMLARPGDFFPDPEARRLFRRRLEYVAARWGHSPAVLAWELWNEVDLVDSFDRDTVRAWHAEMAAALRAADPYGHPVGTSFAWSEGDESIDDLPGLDFVQTHHYGSRDVAATLRSLCLKKSARYAKPHLVGELGVDVAGADNRGDPTGIHLHNGLWAPVVSLSAGTGMLWWWDSYVHPQDLYRHFAPVAAFVRDVEWNRRDWRMLRRVRLAFAGPDDSREQPNLRVLGQIGDRTMALLWLQNRDHTWYRMSQGEPLREVAATRMRFAGLEDGEYAVEWWDTSTGRVTGTAKATCTDGTITVEAPAVRTDVACKVRQR